jgi:membrane protein DedA with SNARE-associated domain
LSPVHAFEEIVAQYGLLALGASVTLESIGLPFPAESALMIASGAAAAGDLDIRAVAAVAFVAAILGDNVGYLIGRRLGRPAILRLGSRFGIIEGGLDRAEAAASRWGPFMVVFARFVVLLRQLNGLVAGTTGMRWPVFLVANTAGAALWVGLWTTLVYRFGHSIELLPALWHHTSAVAAGVVAVVVAGSVTALLLHRRRRP